MFSGIIEATEVILKSRPLDQAHELTIRRPSIFDDISLGDSIAVNGVCLTVESFDAQTLTFTLGFETLKVLGTGLDFWLCYPVNLERSLTIGSRIHGHSVTGHVETLLPVLKSEALGENWILRVGLPPIFQELCWIKGSVTLNGVSLTINSLEDQQLEVCLIPETQKRTNLCHYKVGEKVSFEPDSFAKAISHILTQKLQNGGACLIPPKN